MSARFSREIGHQLSRWWVHRIYIIMTKKKNSAAVGHLFQELEWFASYILFNNVLLITCWNNSLLSTFWLEVYAYILIWFWVTLWLVYCWYTTVLTGRRLRNLPWSGTWGSTWELRCLSDSKNPFLLHGPSFTALDMQSLQGTSDALS